jgi:hypothetical protein
VGEHQQIRAIRVSVEVPAAQFAFCGWLKVEPLPWPTFRASREVCYRGEHHGLF